MRWLSIALPALLIAAACGRDDPPAQTGGELAAAVEDAPAVSPPEGSVPLQPNSRDQVESSAAAEATVLGAPPGGPPYASADGVLGTDGIRHLGTADDPIPIDVDFLGAWTFEEKDQPFPEHVLAANGKVVRIRGFMLPDVDFEHIKRFHLVRSLWGCCFGAPPRLNEIVRVAVPGDDGMDYTYNTLEVTGTLRCVYESEDGVISDLYRIEALQVAVLGYDDPMAPTNFDPSTGFAGKIPGQ